MIKGYIKPVLKILSFLIAFVILLEVFSVTYFSKAMASEYNNKYSETMSFFNEPENSIQIIAIGNSDLYSGYCPSEVWAQNGYTSTAIGSPRQSPRQSFELLKEALSKQDAKVVIIETDMLYDENPAESNIESKENSIDVVFDYLKPESFEEGIKNELSIFMFHDRWKNKKVVNIGSKNHGYKFSDNVVPVVVSDKYMTPTDKKEEIKKVHKNDTNSMISHCKENGIDVILITLPSPSSWNYERHNATQELADENGVAYIDFNTKIDELKIDMNKDFRDKGNHLNYYGAEKVSRYLGNYVAENYEIEDLSKTDDYAYWHDSYAEFRKQFV